MAASRLSQRTLSVFLPSNRLWEPVFSKCRSSQVTQPLPLTSRFSLITQNLDAFSPRPVARAKLLLDDILGVCKQPDIIFLQEVTSSVRTSILGNPKIREAFLVTDAEDQSSFDGVPFANMTLLSSKRFTFESKSLRKDNRIEREGEFTLGVVSRVKLPSKYGRCALSVDITPPSALVSAYRLINVHFDSLGDTLPYRTEQMEILANLLREPGCAGGLIAGDFNAISPEDHALLDKNGLVDAWLALHGRTGFDGATWGVEAERRDGLRPGRLDKVALLGIEAKDIKLLRPGLIEVPKPGESSDYIPYSDHYGLGLTFTV
ncbi:Endonuclease/exonuclease/phosphatase [Flagelloscypha sp. PMI_526]|nr:Endonuclease/exonuclease/phosphatase [Flagelloscypha sp. PMI_526]